MNSWIRIGAAAVGLGIAFYGLGKYEAWWTIAFAIGGLAVLLVAPRQPAGRAVIVGAAVAGLVAIGMLGTFLMLISQFARGDGVPWLASGASLLLGALLLLAFVIRYARRSAPRPLRESDPMEHPIS